MRRDAGRHSDDRRPRRRRRPLGHLALKLLLADLHDRLDELELAVTLLEERAAEARSDPEPCARAASESSTD